MHPRVGGSLGNGQPILGSANVANGQPVSRACKHAPYSASERRSLFLVLLAVCFLLLLLFFPLLFFVLIIRAAASGHSGRLNGQGIYDDRPPCRMPLQPCDCERRTGVSRRCQV